MGVDRLIETHRLTIDVDAGGAGSSAAQASAWPLQAGLTAIPASPMSGDVLPTMLLNAIQDRRHLGDEEVAAIRTRKQKQEVVDLWLEAALELQSQKEALRDLVHRRRCCLSRKAFIGWQVASLASLRLEVGQDCGAGGAPFLLRTSGEEGA